MVTVYARILYFSVAFFLFVCPGMGCSEDTNPVDSSADAALTDTNTPPDDTRTPPDDTKTPPEDTDASPDDAAHSPDTVSPPDCDYYAGPNEDDDGDGLSESSPFTIPDFWELAEPGDTLCLLDGVYAGAYAVIQPPSGLSGTEDKRITVRALHDGEVRMDGEGARIPIRLGGNSWFVIEGVNAHNSSGTVVALNRDADHNIIRRVVGWDGRDANNNIFGIHYNTGNLLEDVAGFGVARKIFSFSQFGDNATCRRCWGRWEASTNVGPKMAFTYMYNNFNVLFENIIGTWDERVMPESYILQQNGTPYGDSPQTFSEVEKPYGVISSDRMNEADTYETNSRVLASLVYIRAEDPVEYITAGASGNRSADAILFRDVMSYIQPGSHDNIRPFHMYRFDGGSGTNATCGPCDRRLEDSTAIGGRTPHVYQNEENGWQVSGYVAADTTAEAPNLWVDPQPGGARLCKRTVDGELTDQPLWPWPMNERILKATTFAARADHQHTIYQGDPPVPTLVTAPHAPVDLTATMEELFGEIPAECRSDR